MYIHNYSCSFSPRFGLVGAIDQQMSLISEDLNSIIEHINGIAATSDMNNPVSVTMPFGMSTRVKGLVLLLLCACYKELFSAGCSDVTYPECTRRVTSVDRASNRCLCMLAKVFSL